MFRTITSALRSAPSALKPSMPPPALIPASSLFPPTNITSLPVFPKHALPSILTTPAELTAWHEHARDTGYLDRADHWAVIDALGIPSAGVGLKLAFLSSKPLVNGGIPQKSLQLLPYIPLVQVDAPEGILHTELLKPESRKLTDPNHSPYVLARSNNGTDFVGGVYMRLLQNKQEAAAARADAQEYAPGNKEAQTGDKSFMNELGALVTKRFFGGK